VTYNSARTIGGALRALRRCHDENAARTIVVDNASTDATKTMIEEHAGWATVIHSPGNIGFGRGCNLGLERVDTPHVVLVNPDAELEPAACLTLSNFLDAHTNAGMVAPAVLDTDGTLQHFGGITTPIGVLRRAVGRYGAAARRRAVAPGDEPFLTDWVCGALFMSPTGFLRGLGGFDPRFFLYFEETDLCRRVTRAGHEIWAVPTAVATHVGGASATPSDQTRIGGCIAKHFFQSRFYYLRKHFGLLPATGAELGELVIISLRVAARALRGCDASDLTRYFHWPILSTPLDPH
jgi:GT2 family glycosyltransferase